MNQAIKKRPYQSNVKNGNFEFTKPQEFDIQQSFPYYNMETIVEFESRELSLKPKTNSSRHFGTLFILCISLFTMLILISNSIALEFIQIPFAFDFPIPCGILCYPLTFLLSHVIAELYGEKQARLMVYIGFMMSLVGGGLIQLSFHWTPSFQTLFNDKGTISYSLILESLFGFNLLTLTSSMVGYILSQILAIRLFAFFKEMTRNRYPWLRYLASNLTAQITDTLIVNLLLLYCGLNMEMETVIRMSITCYALKTIFALLSTPLFYGFVQSVHYFKPMQPNTSPINQ